MTDTIPMTTTDTTTTDATGVGALAAEVARVAGPHADRHDRDGTFVDHGVSAARDLGYLAAPVPVELGGRGATTAELCDAQRIIARACGATGLACSMHLHVVLAAAWRWRHGDTTVEPMLRRVAADRIVAVSTGGNDWTHPTTVATPTTDGWRVSGRKTFASMSPAGDVMATFAVIGEPAPGAEVIAVSIPMTADGVRIDETWDAVGMRGTGSHDIVLDDVTVGQHQVVGRRTWGELDRPLLLASVHAWPVVYATYLGVAEGLADAVVEAQRTRHERTGSTRPTVERLVGQLDAELRTARWALAGALADIGDDPEPTHDSFVTVQLMKRTITQATQEIARIAAEVAGGGAYARRGAVDRMIRDLRAATYHPESPDDTLVRAGHAVLTA